MVRNKRSGCSLMRALPNRRHCPAILAVALAFACISAGEAGFAGAGQEAQVAANKSALAETAAPPPAGPVVIPVALPKVQNVTEYIELTGNAASVNTVKLIARVEGYLEKIHFLDGQLVKQGDLLFTIQQDQYKAQLTQAEAQVRAQEAALVLAKTEVARYAALQKKGAAAQVVVDNWNFQMKKTEADLAAAKAQVIIAKLNLGYTEVRAPCDGQMGRHLVDPGNTVGGVGQQTVLAEIMQLDPIYVVANLSEQEVLRVRQNLGRPLTYAELVRVPVEVGIEKGNEYPYRGTIQYVAPGIDPQTGTLLVRGILRNPDRTLLPGFFVRIRLPKGRVFPHALLVPNRALQTDQGGTYLLVLNRDDVVEKRYVEPGELSGNLRVIVSGLGADDPVVIGDIWWAAPGTKVTPKMLTLDETGRAVESSP